LSCSLIGTFGNLLVPASRTSRVVLRRIWAVVSRRCAPASLRGHTRFVVESRLASDSPRGADGRDGPFPKVESTKGVIRASTIFAPGMVTGEFYARVTTHWVTPAWRPVELFQDKCPACTWLRSSKGNSADQSMTVIKSLCKNFASSSYLRLAVSDATTQRNLSCRGGQPTIKVC
jgi:hypothetical protein